MATALIIGDSQAQGAGSYLQDALQAQGYKVTRASKPGGDSADVADIAQKYVGDKFDLVVVFSGSVADGAPAVATVASLWPTAQKVWYGSSPGTRILNLAEARTKFGKKVTGADYWLTGGEAKAREARNAQLRELVSQAGMSYVDWRNLQLPDKVAQLAGVAFPSQQDGIHVLGATAKAAFAAPNWPNGHLSAANGAGANTFAILALIVIAFMLLRRVA